MKERSAGDSCVQGKNKGGCSKEAPCRCGGSEIKQAQIGNSDPHYPRLRTLKGKLTYHGDGFFGIVVLVVVDRAQ